MRVGKRQRRCLTVLALLAAAGTAHADYKEDYSHGVKAYRDGQYAEARTLIQQALSEHPEPAARIKLYGMVFEPYLPQHYLGMAAFKLGDCTTALAQWNSAENRQIVAQLPEIGGQEQSSSAACQQNVIAKKDDKPAKPQSGAPESTPAVVAENTKPVVADNKPPKPIAPPPKPVEPPPPKPVTSVPVDKPAVAVKNTPPEPLVQAFDNYLQGHYAEVVRINPDSYADTRIRFHAYLVRAASKYTLARIAPDEAMLNGARADAAAAKALDAHITPDATLFSPGFRAFYQESH